MSPRRTARQVAVSLSRGGSEDGDLHIFDVGTGHEIGAAIPHVQYPTAGGAVAWSDDGQSIWYTHFPGPSVRKPDRHFYQTVWVHSSRQALAPITKSALPGLPRVAEITLHYSGVAHALSGHGRQWRWRPVQSLRGDGRWPGPPGHAIRRWRHLRQFRAATAPSIWNRKRMRRAGRC